MYALQEIRLSKDAEPVKEVKVSLERGGIWDLMWAEEDEEMFVIAQKLRAVVYKGREPEVGLIHFCGAVCLDQHGALSLWSIFRKRSAGQLLTTGSL